MSAEQAVEVCVRVFNYGVFAGLSLALAAFCYYGATEGQETNKSFFWAVMALMLTKTCGWLTCAVIAVRRVEKGEAP